MQSLVSEVESWLENSLYLVSRLEKGLNTQKNQQIHYIWRFWIRKNSNLDYVLSIAIVTDLIIYISIPLPAMHYNTFEREYSFRHSEETSRKPLRHVKGSSLCLIILFGRKCKLRLSKQQQQPWYRIWNNELKKFHLSGQRLLWRRNSWLGVSESLKKQEYQLKYFKKKHFCF